MNLEEIKTCWFCFDWFHSLPYLMHCGLSTGWRSPFRANHIVRLSEDRSDFWLHRQYEYSRLHNPFTDLRVIRVEWLNSSLLSYL